MKDKEKAYTKFEKTTPEEDRIAQDEGVEILDRLRNKYLNNCMNDCMRDLDIVLNSLCAALVRLALLDVHPSCYDKFVELCAQTIGKNLKNFSTQEIQK